MAVTCLSMPLPFPKQARCEAIGETDKRVREGRHGEWRIALCVVRRQARADSNWTLRRAYPKTVFVRRPPTASPGRSKKGARLVLVRL